MRQHLRYRLTIYPEQTTRSAFAQTINMARASYTSIQIHRIHLPAFSSLLPASRLRNFTPLRPNHKTVSADLFYSEIHSSVVITDALKEPNAARNLAALLRRTVTRDIDKKEVSDLLAALDARSAGS